MRVCLIYPREINLNFLPLGIGYLGAVLEREGHDVFIYDRGREEIDFIDEVAKKIKPDLIGLSISTPQIEVARHFIKGLRKELPSTPIVCGGNHPTYFKEKLLAELNVDFVIFGEGEMTLSELCHSLEGDKDIKDIKGLAYRKNFRCFCNAPRDIIEDLDSLPYPLRQKFNMESYLRPPGLIRGLWLERSTNIISGRGCFGRCIFCSSHIVFGRKIRRRTAENVIGEIEELIDNYRIDSLWFVDDNFFVDERWVLDFLQKIQDKKINLKWSCQSRVDTVTEKMLIAAKKAGCVQVEFGVETCSPRMLKIIKKGTDAARAETTFRWARKHAIRTLATFIIGFPDETDSDLAETMNKARLLKPDFTLCFYATPYPGSALYENAWENNLFKEKDFSRWFLRTEPVMATGISVEKLRQFRHNFSKIFRWRNAFFFISRPAFIIKLFILMSRKPVIFFKAFKKASKVRCLDDVAYYFLASADRNFYKG